LISDVAANVFTHVIGEQMWVWAIHNRLETLARQAWNPRGVA